MGEDSRAPFQLAAREAKKRAAQGKWDSSISFECRVCFRRLPFLHMKTIFRARVGLAFLLLAVWLLAAGSQRPAWAAELAGGRETVPNPVTITAGPDWIPLKAELDIEPGSALDFSRLGLQDPPAGKHGRVIARSDGQFTFEKRSKIPQRFYGVNLCFSAQYLSHAEADRLADRLMRQGYNAVRLHHYEGELIQGQANSTTLNPDKLERFDYLTAALASRGIYLTTDLFVSRPVPYRELGIAREGMAPMNLFKVLVPVHAGAWENWKQFTRALLNHENPYTKRRYAEDPALAWLSMINEGNFGNYLKEIREVPEWLTAWNTWLKHKYGDRAALAAAWGKELKSEENLPAVALPESINASGLRARDGIAFFSDTERDMVRRMKRFLREELGCRALVTNANAWTNHTTDQAARAGYDYVDDHFYIDHPEFIQRSWQLPSKSANSSPIAAGAPGARDRIFTRLIDKPFTVTEYNYSGPGRFRGVGGILTGAMGALQGWGGIWRFAYSHNRRSMFEPSPMGYFDVANDPLNWAAERATLCLFLRGDLQTAPHSVVVAMTEKELAAPPAKIPQLAPNWRWMGWVTRVGTQVIPDASEALPHTAVMPIGWQASADHYRAKGVVSLNPYEASEAELMDLLKARGILKPGNLTEPSRKVFQSETGEITLDGPRNVMFFNTPRTAGGFAPAGEVIQASEVRIAMRGADATVWVSALDDRPINRSRRLLVTHLTDLQNTDIQYAEPERRTLLGWGRLPHLVRSGQADVKLKLKDAGQYQVWALSPGGRRLAKVPVRVLGNELEFTADVASGGTEGARMLYELGIK